MGEVLGEGEIYMDLGGELGEEDGLREVLGEDLLVVRATWVKCSALLVFSPSYSTRTSSTRINYVATFIF